MFFSDYPKHIPVKNRTRWPAPGFAWLLIMQLLLYTVVFYTGGRIIKACIYLGSTPEELQNRTEASRIMCQLTGRAFLTDVESSARNKYAIVQAINVFSRFERHSLLRCSV